MNNILVLYASATGNTELVAKEIVKNLEQRNQKVVMKEFDFDDIDAKELMDYDTILIGVYTWTDGELPFEVEDFDDQLDEVDLRGKVCGVFGSGDSFYDIYCGAVDMMYDRLEELGADMIPVKLKVDLAPDEEDIELCKIFAEKVISMTGEKVI